MIEKELFFQYNINYLHLFDITVNNNSDIINIINDLIEYKQGNWKNNKRKDFIKFIFNDIPSNFIDLFNIFIRDNIIPLKLKIKIIDNNSNFIKLQIKANLLNIIQNIISKIINIKIICTISNINNISSIVSIKYIIKSFLPTNFISPINNYIENKINNNYIFKFDNFLKNYSH